MDLHVLPHVEDEKSCAEIARLLHLAGYSTAGLTVPTGLMQDRVHLLKRIFHETGIETVLRIDLEAKSREELLRLLRRFRNSYDIISVKCTNQSTAPIACRDGRVDLVLFDPRNSKVRFDHSLANLLRGALEFNLPSTLLRETDRAALSRMSKEASVARMHKVRVVLSSGCFSPLTVRSPQQVAAVASAIGLSREQSLRGVSEVPLAIVRRNLLRRSREYVEEGVRLVMPRSR